MKWYVGSLWVHSGDPWARLGQWVRPLHTGTQPGAAKCPCGPKLRIFPARTAKLQARTVKLRAHTVKWYVGSLWVHSGDPWARLGQWVHPQSPSAHRDTARSRQVPARAKITHIPSAHCKVTSAHCKITSVAIVWQYTKWHTYHSAGVIRIHDISDSSTVC